MRRLILIIAIPLIMLAGWYGYQRLQALPTAQQPPRYETMVVQQGTIASTVSAIGSIEPNATVSLAFRTPGLVSDVHVTPGQHVSKGEVLAALDTTELVLQLAQAEANLEIIQAQYAKLQRPPSEHELSRAQMAVDAARNAIAAAEATLASAQAAYDKLLAGPTEQERTVTLAKTMEAEAQVKRAQQAYDLVKDVPQVGALPQSLELERATLALEVARAEASLLDLPPDDAAIAAANSQIAQAEAALYEAQANLITAESNLAALQEGPLPEDLEIMRVQVRQAQLGVLQAEYNIERNQLIAPFDGVIVSVNVTEGQYSSAGLPDIVLADVDLHMKVLVDEIDIRDVQVGQPVQISLDALSDAQVTGRLVRIAEAATVVNGVMAYEGVIELDPTSAPLRAGMSATANITTSQLDDALYVENRFIQIDRETGQASVYKLVDNEPVLQEVVLGVRNDTVTQIVEGLAAGDRVAFVVQDAQEQLRNTLFGGN